MSENFDNIVREFCSRRRGLDECYEQKLTDGKFGICVPEKCPFIQQALPALMAECAEDYRKRFIIREDPIVPDGCVGCKETYGCAECRASWLRNWRPKEGRKT